MTAHLGGAAGEPPAAEERPTPGDDSTGSVVEDIRSIFAAADAVGSVTAWQVGRPDDAVEVDADKPVAVASVITIVTAWPSHVASPAGRSTLTTA